MKIILLFTLLAAVMITADARTIAYISNADSAEIYVVELDTKTGALTLIEKVPVTGTVMPLAVSPDHKYLYAGLRSEPFSASSFSIDPKTGKLTFIKTSLLADNMAYISTDHTGRYLFGASYTGNRISVNRIGPDGIVEPTPLQVIETGKNAHCILTDRSNKFLFASNLGEDHILQYRFDAADGRVKPNTPPFVETKQGAGPRHFVFHSNGRLVFSTNELDATVNSYRLDARGAMSLVGTASLLPDGSTAKQWASDLHLTPNGKFLYAAERTTSSLTAFSVNASTGRLTEVGRFDTETQPRGFNIDPSGHFLIASGQTSNSVTVYEIDQKSGRLVEKSKMAVGKNPNWIEIIGLRK